MHQQCSRSELGFLNSANWRAAKWGLPSVAIQALFMLSVLMIASVAQAQTNPKHFFWAPGQPNTPNPSSLANDLIYHGGNAGRGAIGVENKPATYLIFWGPDWANGFTTTDAKGQVFTSQQLQNYVTSFLTNLGGTSWAAISDGVLQ
jgi:hypothetical protein